MCLQESEWSHLFCVQDMARSNPRFLMLAISLYIPDFEPFPLFTHSESNVHGIESFIKLVVKRSNGKALGFSTEKALRYVSDACPNLRVLSLPDDLMIFKHSQIIPEVIGKWKFLEQLCARR